MDCKNCEMCDGPICGMPCTHYLECYELEMKQRMNDINNNIGVCMTLCDKADKRLKQPIKVLSPEEYFKQNNQHFQDGQADPFGALDIE